MGGMCSPPRPGCAPVVLLHWPWRPPHSSLHIPEWCSSSLVWGTGARWITCAQVGKYGVLCQHIWQAHYLTVRPPAAGAAGRRRRTHCAQLPRALGHPPGSRSRSRGRHRLSPGSRACREVSRSRKLGFSVGSTTFSRLLAEKQSSKAHPPAVVGHHGHHVEQFLPRSVLEGVQRRGVAQRALGAARHGGGFELGTPAKTRKLVPRCQQNGPAESAQHAKQR